MESLSQSFSTEGQLDVVAHFQGLWKDLEFPFFSCLSVITIFNLQTRWYFIKLFSSLPWKFTCSAWNLYLPGDSGWFLPVNSIELSPWLCPFSPLNGRQSVPGCMDCFYPTVLPLL